MYYVLRPRLNSVPYVVWLLGSYTHTLKYPELKNQGFLFVRMFLGLQIPPNHIDSTGKLYIAPATFFRIEDR